MDTERYMVEARRLRARVIGRWLLAAPGALRERWRRSALGRLLGTFSARELRDIGLCRSDIDAVVDGSFFADASRRRRAGGERRA